MSSVAVNFRLNELLEEEDKTAYALSKESGVSLTTLYKITKNRTRRVDMDTLNALLNGLNKLTGKVYEVSSIIGYTQD